MCLSRSCDYICLIFGAFYLSSTIYTNIPPPLTQFSLEDSNCLTHQQAHPCRAATCLSQKMASHNGYSQLILKCALQSWREETINHRGLNLEEMKMYMKCQSSEINHLRAVPHGCFLLSIFFLFFHHNPKNSMLTELDVSVQQTWHFRSHIHDTNCSAVLTF